MVILITLVTQCAAIEKLQYVIEEALDIFVLGAALTTDGNIETAQEFGFFAMGFSPPLEPFSHKYASLLILHIFDGPR